VSLLHFFVRFQPTDSAEEPYYLRAADVMKRVAAPMVGGLATSLLLELLVYPAVYLLWRWHSEVRHAAAAVPEP